MNRSEKLGNYKIPRLLWQFSIPSITGMFVNAVYNVVDRIYVGHIGGGIGTKGISALTVVFPIQLLILGFGVLVGLGGSALISIALGEKHREKAEHLAGNGFILMIIIGFITSILGLVFLKKILLIAGATEDNYNYAYGYLRIIFFFSTFQFIGYGLNSYIRGEGNPLRSMLSMFAGAITNIILDPIFIFVFKMGIEGAALATGLSLVVTAVWNFYYFTGGQSMLKLRLKYLKPDFKISSSILKNGFAPFFMQAVASLMNIILNNQIKKYGGSPESITLSQAALGVVQGFNMLFFMPIMGINMGAQPIIGFNFGAKKYDRVKQTLFYSILYSLVFTLTCFAVSRFFPELVYKAFNGDDMKLAAFGPHVMRIVLMSFPVMGIYAVCTQYFQSSGKPVHATFLGLSRPLLFLIPLMMILPVFFGLTGLWYSIPLADVFSTALTSIFMIFEIRHLNKKHKESRILSGENAV